MSPPGKQQNVAVIGVGHLGQHHARIYAGLEGCRLIAVADRDPARSMEVASRHGVESLGDHRALLDGRLPLPDAVSVAVPTKAHLSVAAEFLAAGVPVLVEKPIAMDLEEADRMILIARQAGVILGVGHTERFNPAVQALRDRAGAPRFIEAHRLGSFSPRSLDIDVVLDLMIHDIDVTLDLVRSPVVSVEAVGVNALTPRVDIANARIVFESGCVANLTASRISAARTRKIRVFQTDSYLSCDCAERSLEHYRLERAASSERPAIIRDQVEIPQDEPLRRELESFLRAVRGREKFPVTGESGREALAVALTVVAKIRQGQAGGAA